MRVFVLCSRACSDVTTRQLTSGLTFSEWYLLRPSPFSSYWYIQTCIKMDTKVKNSWWIPKWMCHSSCNSNSWIWPQILKGQKSRYWMSSGFKTWQYALMVTNRTTRSSDNSSQDSLKKWNALPLFWYLISRILSINSCLLIPFLIVLVTSLCDTSR